MSKQLVIYKGKYWYANYHRDKNKRFISLIDMKDSSLGINVYHNGFRFPGICLCTDVSQYNAVIYWQEQGIAWICGQIGIGKE